MNNLVQISKFPAFSNIHSTYFFNPETHEVFMKIGEKFIPMNVKVDLLRENFFELNTSADWWKRTVSDIEILASIEADRRISKMGFIRINTLKKYEALSGTYYYHPLRNEVYILTANGRLELVESEKFPLGERYALANANSVARTTVLAEDLKIDFKGFKPEWQKVFDGHRGGRFIIESIKREGNSFVVTVRTDSQAIEEILNLDIGDF